MTAGRDLHRLLWAVGEARRLRNVERHTTEGGDRDVTAAGDGGDGRPEEPALTPTV